MTKKEAIKEFVTNSDRLIFKVLINEIYKEGYMIITPEELKKIDSITVLAHIHGMNPF